MKKSIFSGLMILFLLSNCARQETTYPQGAWKLIQAQSIENGKVTTTYPGILIGNEYKMWSEKNFMFVGRWEEDTIITDNYGYGTYTLEGNEYEETVLYHFVNNYQGKSLKMTLELKNDTLIQVYHPVDSIGRQSENVSSVEKYIRMK
ncbi:MAG TPA: hypothetical protein VI583_08885 [Cyclobacteriaceae bacterium]|nr:hypothetical protein [Cyclobacteriaceae bacterium]